MRGLALMSGGIDSPVAAGMMMRRGIRVDLVYFDGGSFSSTNELDKARSNARTLFEMVGRSGQIHAMDHAPALGAFGRAQNLHLRCVLCKRMMIRCAGILAQKVNADILITGDSLGQVASQTLPNLQLEEMASPLPVVRPLIGLDKREIENMARDFGTYDVSTSQSTPCGAVPGKPATRARRDQIEAEEMSMGMEELVNNALASCRQIALDGRTV